MRVFKVNQRYVLIKSSSGIKSTNPDGTVTCCYIDSDGDMWASDVTFMGLPSIESASGRWCVATTNDLYNGSLIPV